MFLYQKCRKAKPVVLFLFAVAVTLLAFALKISQTTDSAGIFTYVGMAVTRKPINTNLKTLLRNVDSSAKSSSLCLNDWPDLDLYLVASADLTGEIEYNSVFLPSLALFWPERHIKFRIITDGDSENGAWRNFCDNVLQKTSQLIKFEPSCHLTWRQFPCRGWHKSQWLKFWADNYTNSEFVGFVDTDTLFVTRVTSEDLLRDGKPIVRPVFGKFKSSNVRYWKRTPAKTFKYTGFKETFNCMTFFPVIVKTKHLAKFREVIIGHVLPNRTFDEAFAVIAREQQESEYNIMCTLMWNLFRDEYYWIINESEIGWRGHVPGQVYSFEEAGITEDLVRPEPMITTHWGHPHRSYGMDVLRRGVCFSMPHDDPRRPDGCNFYPNRNSFVNEFEFTFEDDYFANRTGALQAHLRRLERIDKCPHPWMETSLKYINW